MLKEVKRAHAPWSWVPLMGFWGASLPSRGGDPCGRTRRGPHRGRIPQLATGAPGGEEGPKPRLRVLSQVFIWCEFCAAHAELDKEPQRCKSRVEEFCRNRQGSPDCSVGARFSDIGTLSEKLRRALGSFRRATNLFQGGASLLKPVILDFFVHPGYQRLLGRKTRPAASRALDQVNSSFAPVHCGMTSERYTESIEEECGPASLYSQQSQKKPTVGQNPERALVQRQHG